MLSIQTTEHEECRAQAVPMVGIYFPLYDALTAHLEASSAWVAPYAPLLAGSAARTVAVLCTSPLELIRTRMQASLDSGTALTISWQSLMSRRKLESTAMLGSNLSCCFGADYLDLL